MHQMCTSGIQLVSDITDAPDISSPQSHHSTLQKKKKYLGLILDSWKFCLLLNGGKIACLLLQCIFVSAYFQWEALTLSEVLLANVMNIGLFY